MSKWSVKQDAVRQWTVYDTTGDNLNEISVHKKVSGEELATLLNNFEKNYNTLVESQKRLLKEVKELREIVNRKSLMISPIAKPYS